jgi:hypothetical protein
MTSVKRLMVILSHCRKIGFFGFFLKKKPFVILTNQNFLDAPHIAAASTSSHVFPAQRARPGALCAVGGR